MVDGSAPRGEPVATAVVSDLLHRAAAFQRAGQLEAAIESCRAALTLDGRNFDAWFMLSGIEVSRGQAEAALEAIDRALEQASTSALGLCRRGSILRLLKRPEDAAASQRQALAVDPRNAEAHNNLGNCLRDLCEIEEALQHYRRAVEAKPDYVQALNNLGVAQQDLGQDAAALETFGRAVARRPDYANAHFNRGITLVKLARPAEAVDALRNAVRLAPQDSAAHLQLAIALLMMDRETEAEASLSRAVALLDGTPEAEFELSVLLLMRGRLKQGWRHYDARLRALDIAPIRPELPQWTGEPISGKSILVQSEQGLGDVLQFCRYVPLLAARGARVTFLVPPALVRLLKPLAAVAEVTSKLRRNARFDFRCFLMSLPGLLGTELGTVPWSGAYFVAEAEGLAHWREVLGGDGFKIAICWQGNPAAKVDKGRSIPLAAFAPLSSIPGVRLISLQKRFGLDQLEHLPGGLKIEQLDAFDDGGDAFVDSAAVIGNCDLVVTSDTSMAHLAGALGAPTWVALSATADWRWLRGRSDSPWYPSLTLFRQRTPGNWSTVFAEMAEALKGRVAEKASGEITRQAPEAAQPTAPVSWGELFDKISILEIKSERIKAKPALVNVRRELEALQAVAAAAERHAGLGSLRQALREINEALWDIEDEIRSKEAEQAFDARFVALARSVYQTNDRRAEIKRKINDLLGSGLVEEKQYTRY